jgi:hypothetical protein
MERMDGDLFCDVTRRLSGFGYRGGGGTVFEWQINGLNFLAVNTVSF